MGGIRGRMRERRRGEDDVERDYGCLIRMDGPSVAWKIVRIACLSD